MRKIEIWINQQHLRLVKGVYMITIGGKRYVGSAENLYYRMYSHEMSLNRALAMYPDCKPSCAMHYYWARYIYENEGIKYCTVDVLQRCISDSDLYYAEQFYLNEFAGHPDFLNQSKTTRRPKGMLGGEDKLWDLEVLPSGYPVFFNPLEPENKIDCFADLTKKGTPRIIKEKRTPEEKAIAKQDAEKFVADILAGPNGDFSMIFSK